MILDFGETHPELEEYYTPEADLNNPSRSMKRGQKMMKTIKSSPQSNSQKTGFSSTNNNGESLDSGLRAAYLKECNSASTF